MIPITCNAVGDILALATLVIDVARALNDARGSSSEYRSFIDELNAVHAMLASAARIAEGSIDGTLRDQIICTVDQCGGDIQRALARVVRFSALGRDGVAGDGRRVKLKRNWYKVEWRFLQRNEAQTFRIELARATQRLTTLLVISEADGAVCFRKNLIRQVDASVVRDTTLLRAIDSGTTAIMDKLDAAPRRGQASVQELSDSIPVGVGSRTAAIAVLCAAVCAMHAPYDRTVPTALLLVVIYILSQSAGRHERALVHDVAYSAANAVTLLDAMGRRLVLPLALCETRELFHATLVKIFSRTDGHWFISSRRYGIMIEGETRYISDRDNWTFQPATEVKMAIIVQSAVNVAADAIHCPVCLVTTAKSMTCPNSVCSVCGRELKGYCVAPSRLGILVDDALERAPQTIEYDANDSGRFPRASSMKIEGTQRTSFIQPSFQLSDIDESSDSRKQLSDSHTPGNQPEPFLNWRDLIHGFTRFSIHGLPPPLFAFSIVSSELGRRELHIAAENGHYPLIAKLLDRGEDVNVSLPSGYTALLVASLHGHTRVVELLLDRGAVIDAATKDDITPFACAVYHNHLETTALLVGRGAMVDASESMRTAGLYAAAYANNVDIVQMLLSLGLDINALFNAGETALHAAVRRARRGSKDVVEMLLRNGADVHVHSKTGDTPLFMAARHGDAETFALLCTSRPEGTVNDAMSSISEQDLGQLLHFAVRKGSHHIVQMILERTTANLDKHFQDGSTQLPLASERGHEKIVELFLSRGADPNAVALSKEKREEGLRWNALHAAAYNGRLKIADMLLRHGADVNACTEYGDTPLSLALEGKRTDLKVGWSRNMSLFDKITDILLSWGAVTDERCSLLLQDIACLGGLSNGRSDLSMPGAWCENGEPQDLC